MNKVFVFGGLAAAGLAGGVLLGGGSRTAQESPDDGINPESRGRVEDVTWLLQNERVSGVPLRDIFAPAGSEAAAQEKKKPALTFVNRKPARAEAPQRQVKAWQPPRLVGIAIHRGMARAVFVDGDKVLIARVGDRVSGYRIRRIQERQVDVQDLRNGLKRTIYLK